jgi:hypothetical protein
MELTQDIYNLFVLLIVYNYMSINMSFSNTTQSQSLDDLD